MEGKCRLLMQNHTNITYKLNLVLCLNDDQNLQRYLLNKGYFLLIYIHCQTKVEYELRWV